VKENLWFIYLGSEVVTHSSTTRPPFIKGKETWCDICQNYTQRLTVPQAADLIKVSARTIYRYLEEGRIHSCETATKRRRVCANSLFKSPE
jgi:excisionase family DNA binding protein